MQFLYLGNNWLQKPVLGQANKSPKSDIKAIIGFREADDKKAIECFDI